MKVQVCIVLVVVLAAALVVEAGPAKNRNGSWHDFLREATSEVCGDDKCYSGNRKCYNLRKPLNLTEEIVEEVRTNLTECASDLDFSALELGDIGPKGDEQQAYVDFMTKFKVGDITKQYALLRCFTERSGYLPTLLSCLREAQANAENEAE
ncbi:uncharacterized protein LOC135091819 [Scylla paramamosain]|uniref:uncharacterized protein LOC135091819 n=1 Tax=Scylla paramamosain TaxID=85552 RepID=UPI0030831DF1